MRDKRICPACNAPSMGQVFMARPLDYSLKERFNILVCGQCGHGKTEVALEGAPHMSALYEGGSYDSEERAWHLIVTPFLRYLEQKKLKYLGSEKSIGRRLLEVGCGKGRFLEVARNAGYKVYGLEPSARSYALAHLRLGDVVAPAGLESIENAEGLKGQYDIIVLWHVLEHLLNPDEVLMRIRGLLAAEGKVLIAVPNFASYQAKIGKENWYHLDPPRHLHHFTPKSLKVFVERNDLSVERVFFNSFYHDYVGELITLTNILLPDKNVVFNMLRLNPNYIDDVGWRRALSMLIMALSIKLISAAPLLFWTLLTQGLSRSGTMVALVTHKVKH